MNKLRIAFMGTPMFAVPSLSSLVGAGHEVTAVYTQPPRRSGRGQKIQKSPIHDWSDQHGLTVQTPVNFNGNEVRAEFVRQDIDIAVVVAYGLILPKPILCAPRFGCVNVHASLLPRWRGAAPIQRAIMAGDTTTGVSIMFMEEGLDTGPVLGSEKVSIGPEMIAGDLHDVLATVGAKLLTQVLNEFGEGPIAPMAQKSMGVTYAKKIEKSEHRIDWRNSSEAIRRCVRAFAPWPGAWFEFKGERVKVLVTKIGNGTGMPGEVLDDKLTIACGDGSLRLMCIQREGRRPVVADEFLRGTLLARGTILS